MSESITFNHEVEPDLISSVQDEQDNSTYLYGSTIYSSLGRAEDGKPIEGNQTLALIELVDESNEAEILWADGWSWVTFEARTASYSASDMDRHLSEMNLPNADAHEEQHTREVERAKKDIGMETVMVVSKPLYSTTNLLAKLAIFTQDPNTRAQIADFRVPLLTVGVNDRGERKLVYDPNDSTETETVSYYHTFPSELDRVASTINPNIVPDTVLRAIDNLYLLLRSGLVESIGKHILAPANTR